MSTNPVDTRLAAESQRILAEYDRRASTIPADFYALHHPFNLFMHQEHERLLLDCLRRSNLLPPNNRRILEVGCGEGNWLAVCERLGFERQNLAGMELGSERAAQAARKLPGADVRRGDAAQLPWDENEFDVSFQRMMFSSILDPATRSAAAKEMMRVTRPDGAIIWVDFFVNPRNPHVRGMGRSEVRALFPGWRATLFRTTLAPPIARRLVGISWGLARALEWIRICNTFYFGYLTRSPGGRTARGCDKSSAE